MEPDAAPDAVPAYTWAAPRRRTSMEEDQLYRDLITVKAKARDEATRVKATATVTAQTPAMPAETKKKKEAAAERKRSMGHKDEPRRPGGPDGKGDGEGEDEEEEDVLPPYSCDIHVESVFQRKMEIEGATKRADDRSWSAVYVVLHGTALNVYRCKSGWSLNRSKMGPDLSQDRPPWSKAGPLEKSYSLAYADVGIAADYVKRKHVIRIRAESDQFLISCVELETFVTWLDALFAAISIAAPIDDRDFPRDQSIPRIQRSRLARGQQPASTTTTIQVGGTNVRITTHVGDGGAQQPQQQQQQQQQRPPPTPTPAAGAPASTARTTSGRSIAASVAVNFTAELREEQYSATRRRGASTTTATRNSNTTTTNNNNRNNARGAKADGGATDDGEASGKWRPKHKWTATHDMVYAKLCYANLLFKSPRKSNFIVAEGIQWLVDWTSGKMIRVHPPKYSDAELFGPWQVVSVGNGRL